jgi:hypothetical protein
LVLNLTVVALLKDIISPQKHLLAEKFIMMKRQYITMKIGLQISLNLISIMTNQIYLMLQQLLKLKKLQLLELKNHQP